MTSPDRKVPAGAYVGSSAPNNVANLQAVNWAGIAQGTIADLLTSYQSVNTAGQILNGANATAAASASAAVSGSGAAQSTASAAQNTAAANSASVASLLPPTTPSGTPGSTLSDTFARTTLGSAYNPIKSGSVANLVIVGNQVELDSTGSNSGTGSVVALDTTTLLTDDQSVSLVIGAANNSASAATGIVLRADPNLLTFAYAWIYSNQVHIGAGTRSGGTNAYSDWTSGSVTVNSGDTVTFTAIGANYQLLVNNYPVLGYSDSTGTVPTGSGRRSIGFACSYNSGNFSFAVAALNAADRSAAVPTGTGWSLVRGSTVSVASAAGAGMRVTGVYDTVRQAADVTVVSVGAGQVQVNRAGWYLISAAFNFTNYDVLMRTELWSAPSLGGTWGLLRAGAVGSPYDTDSNGNSVANSNATSGSFVVYLPKGAVVAPGLTTTNSNALVGPFTCFDGALLNWL
ncbi:hypothetical protein [Nocardia sp. BMG111209]|uniref:hypothetical protein n=1 Tax=Nocardia sp. BMG111209 TaxID=1160137 RepID=UPI00039D028B|nr:hypothetical protein [Nocardia sp. BMG111209]